MGKQAKRVPIIDDSYARAEVGQGADLSAAEATLQRVIRECLKREPPVNGTHSETGESAAADALAADAAELESMLRKCLGDRNASAAQTATEIAHAIGTIHAAGDVHIHIHLPAPNPA